MSDLSPVENVLARLEGVRRAGAGWLARCPAHEDRNPSLSVGEGDDGRALLHCHAGCSHAAIAGALGLAPADLFPPAPAAGRPSPRRAKAPPKTYPTAREALAAVERVRGRASRCWTYRDADGSPVGLAARWDEADGGKAVLPFAKLPNGWANRAMPEPRPLYRLPEVNAAGGLVLVVEGEKAADAAATLGYAATTSAGGCKAARLADWAPLAGRSVVILPDADAPGEKYAADVLGLLSRLTPAPAVRVARLPDLPEGGDVADVLEAHTGDLDAARAVVAAAIDAAEAPALPPEATAAPPAIGRLVTRRLADVPPEAVRWLWPERIALGKVSLIAGNPGLGKSFVTCDLAARVSRGLGWPDLPEARREPSGVLIVNAEDDLGDTLRPRLDAAGADVDRIDAIEGVATADPKRPGAFGLSDAEALDEYLRGRPDVRLVVIDPVSAFVGGTDDHKNAEVRGLLRPLSELAARHRVAVLLVTHLNKGGNGGMDSVARIAGSGAWGAAARAAFAVVRDPDDDARRLLLPIKNNLGDDRTGLAYRIEPAGGGQARVAWEECPVDVRADDLLAPTGRDRPSKLEEAVVFLAGALADGPRPVGDLEHEARMHGVAKRTLERAKETAGVGSVRGSDGRWYWAKHGEERRPMPAGGVGDVGGVDPSTDAEARQDRQGRQGRHSANAEGSAASAALPHHENGTTATLAGDAGERGRLLSAGPRLGVRL